MRSFEDIGRLDFNPGQATAFGAKSIELAGHAALLVLAITTPHIAAADIDASQADARLIGMPIFTADGLLIGQVANVETYGSTRSLIAAVGGYML